jgi:hypothetical protein
MSQRSGEALLIDICISFILNNLAKILFEIRLAGRHIEVNKYFNGPGDLFGGEKRTTLDGSGRF